jgi:hypothetical protein
MLSYQRCTTAVDITLASDQKALLQWGEKIRSAVLRINAYYQCLLPMLTINAYFEEI